MGYERERVRGVTGEWGQDFWCVNGGERGREGRLRVRRKEKRGGEVES